MKTWTIQAEVTFTVDAEDYSEATKAAYKRLCGVNDVILLACATEDDEIDG